MYNTYIQHCIVDFRKPTVQETKPEHANVTHLAYTHLFRTIKLIRPNLARQLVPVLNLNSSHEYNRERASERHGAILARLAHYGEKKNVKPRHEFSSHINENYSLQLASMQ